MSSRVLVETERRPVSLLAALGASGVSTVLLAAGSVLPVVAGTERGFASGPMLIVLAVLPFAAALAFATRGRQGMAAGVLVGIAVLAPGRVLLDLQFVADPSTAARPELYLPADLLPHTQGPGLWLLVAGHAVAALAGLFAVRAAGELGEAGEPGQGFGGSGGIGDAAFGGGAGGDRTNGGNGEHADDVRGGGGSGPGVRGRAATGDGGLPGMAGWRQRWLLVVVVAAVVAAFGLLMAPFESADLYLLVRNAFEGPALPLVGYLAVAAALPLAAAFFMTSSDGAFSRGGLVGLATGTLAIAVPGLVSGLVLTDASVTSGPVVALVAVIALVAVAATNPDAGRRITAGRGTEEVRVPGRRKLQVATGVFAVLTAVSAFAGAFMSQLATTGVLTPPESPTRELLAVAGGAVGLLGLGMFVPAVAVIVRPALSVVWVGVLVAGTSVLDTVITATSVPGVLSAGPGVLWAWLAMLAAVVTACCSAVAGVVERDDADELTADAASDAGMNLLTPVVAAGVLTIAAFGSPVISAPDYVAPGLWSEFGTPSWGLLAGVLTVLGALALALRSRPVPAAAMLVGAACVLGLHAATLPLGGDEIEGAGPGIGFWFALAGAVASLVAAVIAVAASRRSVEQD
ncbi:hypothetical protein BAY61_03225 [Prauserella marina]|uniref:Uncharacterized protein n=1 Tax=Prauserella marina TaxID=530584 RepID=A0A222VJR8_9PSEU|nr:hypothetical protein [Prauserella marina]ASR34168.1 hypothetical protein BAY61_03225 [Prauserella marina]PWV82820.1 hypothetical protein DES30_1021067 [Prauserella marina]SDC78045.1 hypothetical protein SAMN05421630_103603 [Prauserella marina]